MFGFIGRIRSSWRQSRIQRYLTCYVQQRHLVDTDQLRSEQCPLFLPGGGDKAHFMCLQLVHRICSASDKFHLMTIKLLYAFSDKQAVWKENIFPIFSVTYQWQTTKHIQQSPKLCLNSKTVCRQNIFKRSIQFTSNSNIVNYSISLCGLARWRTVF